MKEKKKRLLYCLSCEQMIQVPEWVEVGDLFECWNCAGVMIRLIEGEDGPALKVVQMVRCPACGGKIPVDDDTPAGTILSHDGKDFRLAKEFGAFTLEPAAGRRASS
ncbi:MAG: hypothetical protein O2807_00750 [bacterium]|nr:hypothetical protein [bacterium]